MADADPARRWHSGAVLLSDIDKLANPNEAPHTIRFPGAMAAIFQSQRLASYPGRRSKEQGGTIVADSHGRLSIQNLGGMGSTAGTFTPNLMTTDAVKFRVVGVFHTHPYDWTEGSMTGVSFSGGDIGALVLTSTIISVVQSGPRMFVYLKTAMTPAYIDYAAVHAAANAELEMRVKAGQAFQQASRIIARNRSNQYGLAYYQGGHGVATRV